MNSLILNTEDMFVNNLDHSYPSGREKWYAGKQVIKNYWPSYLIVITVTYCSSSKVSRLKLKI